MRITGDMDVNAANVELKNRKGEPMPERPINAEDIGAIVEDKRAQLIAEHGPGQFTHSLDASHSQITWQFDYAEKVGTGNHDAPLIDDEFVEAIRIARINMCNMASVKLNNDTGKYEAIDPADECAVGKCTSINRIEEFLEHYDKNTKRG